MWKEIRSIYGSDLKCGKTTQCLKCLHKSKEKKYGEIPLCIFNKIKRHAINRNRKLEIDINYLWELFLKQNRKCAISGVDLWFPPNSVDIKLGNASLDIKDSSGDYDENNFQWVHKDINWMKQDYSQEEFIKWCETIIDYQRGIKHSNSNSSEV